MRSAMSTDGRPCLGDMPYWQRKLSVVQAVACVGPRKPGGDEDE